MREYPKDFTGESVRAILAGRKTQVRQVLNDDELIAKPERWRYDGLDENSDLLFFDIHAGLSRHERADCTRVIKVKGGKIGDRLWVRETWQVCDGKSYYTKADCKLHKTTNPECAALWTNEKNKMIWRPPVVMPMWASRINLEITGLRAERLQEITEVDAIADGVEINSGHVNVERLFDDLRPDLERISAAQQAFSEGWDKLNVKSGFSWDSNPWVIVREFKRL